MKPRPSSHKNDTSDRQAITRRDLMPGMYTRIRRYVKSVEIQITLKVSSVQPRSFNASLFISVGALPVSVIRRNKLPSNKVHSASYKKGLLM